MNKIERLNLKYGKHINFFFFHKFVIFPLNFLIYLNYFTFHSEARKEMCERKIRSLK